jgi:hypothetical protein
MSLRGQRGLDPGFGEAGANQQYHGVHPVAVRGADLRHEA